MGTATKEKERMGKVKVTLALANSADEEIARRRLIKRNAIRRVEIEAVVDTGATQLVLPAKVAKALGLRRLGRVWVRSANEARAMRDIVGGVTLRLMGRIVTVDAIVEPDKEYALLGQIPLEGLDLHVDPRGQRLIPNPESPDMPLAEMQ